LLKRWSEEATIKISENLLSPEACFGVPATNKLRYNALCKKMSGLADACFAPDKYKIASQGIDKVWEDVKAAKSAASMKVDECQEQSTVNTVIVKNPPANAPAGRPKNKVERKKSIVQQVKEKAIKKSKSTKKKGSKKPPPCSYCHEDSCWHFLAPLLKIELILLLAITLEMV
jgi:hypothetical protein